MQKCLHSPNKRKSRKMLSMLLFAVVCVVCYFAGRLDRPSADVPVQYVKPMYLQLFDRPYDDGFSADSDNVEQTEIKMNNDKSKNSNSAVENVNLQQAITVPTYVSVVDKSGRIIQIKVEDYVLGCLIGEMPLTFHPQALMAQSVAIRSFTLNKLSETSKHGKAVCCMNPACCQNYMPAENSGYSQELLNIARQAVKATENIVAVSGGVPINAVYHASSAEKTKDSADVWGGEIQYLKSVKSPQGEAQICFSSYSGKGGHGVGMSQQGANLLAKEGKSYKEILEYYYSGISFDVVRYNDSL